MSHVKLPLKGVALQGGVAATLAGVALHCATKLPTLFDFQSESAKKSANLRKSAKIVRFLRFSFSQSARLDSRAIALSATLGILG